MPAAVVLVCAYAGGAVAGGAVLAAGATMVTAVVAGALVGAAIGAVGAAVTGGDIKKSAIMGALAGAGGAYLSGPAVASSGYVGGATTAKVATGAETMAGTEVAASSVAPTGAEAMTGTTTTTTIPGAVTPPPPPPPPPPISETTKVLAGLAAGQTLGGYLQGKGTAEAKSEELQAQQDQRGQMFAGMEMSSVSAAAVADKPRNLKREFDLYLNESSKFLAAMQKQVTPGTTAPAEVI